jgi:hypothetical protein
MSLFDTPLIITTPQNSQKNDSKSKQDKEKDKQTLEIIIVDKSGSLKSLQVKDFKEEEIFKKCGLKKPDGFVKQTEWSIKIDGKKYYVWVYAKTDGKANNENKYDFPPPIDTKLFFGSCAIVCKMKCEDKTYSFVNLSLAMWEKMYEKLFGGFEDLAVTCIDDDLEIDELDAIPAEKKTKQGYLKDGFVVDSEDTEDEYISSSEVDEDDSQSTQSNEIDDELDLEDIGSELSEDDYSYSDDDHDKKNDK